MPKPSREFENTYVINRFKNQTNAAEGGGLPPVFRRGIRVPTVGNLQIIQKLMYSDGAQFTLTFTEPNAIDSNLTISNYVVYINSLQNAQQLSKTSLQGLTLINAPITIQGSPAIVHVKGLFNQKVTLTVQTVLSNGQISELELSPSVSANIVEGDSTLGKFINGSSIYLVDATSGNQNMYLPLIRSVQRSCFFVKKVDTSVNTVTVNRLSTDTIEGATSLVITGARNCVQLYAPDDSSDWKILSYLVYASPPLP